VKENKDYGHIIQVIA